MATAKFKMPTDKEIWAEVDARLERFPESFKQRLNLPSRDIQFKEKKAWYKDTPKRLADAKKAKEEAAKANAAADKAFTELREAHGKSVVTAKQFLEKYPKTQIQVENLSLHEINVNADCLAQIDIAFAIRKKTIRVRAISRSLLFNYLSQAYGLYRRINKSEVADKTYEQIRSLLWNNLNVKTHEDIPRASLLLKLVFSNLLEKTIHL